ncbi:sigma-70 family RNA polymerase sigma factor [Pseudokineococcus basanitobsidens]|uniref:Sigma-70 family RNA polymerase sigma factor n=1 Tax=Pseudokineococcus basanitobsidens TaxID=1926649 RepID=A0ABU8RPL8_9ACTN
MPDSDEDVLVRSLHRPVAFEELVRRHSAPVHGYLQRRSSAQIADDLLAETWLQAFASRGSYDPGRGPVRAWVFGVARHVLFAAQRQHRRAHQEGSRSEAVTDPAPDWDAVDARLDAAATAPALRSGLASLTGPDRELLLLVVWEQLSPTEAAAVLDIPPGTARSRLHRARRQLRHHVSTPGPTVGDPAASPPSSRRPS